MKRMLAGFGLLMAALTGIAILGLDWGWPRLEALRLAPRMPFKAPPALPDTAYAGTALWIARPDLPSDPARYLPPGVEHHRKGIAFVFFLHPTTYLGRKLWNAPIDHANSQMRAALAVRSMASVFNDEAGIYAPRYRQAALGTFLIDQPEQEQALALAQSDAQIAFDMFLRTVPASAPIVLAGDGQGALILMRLIREAGHNTGRNTAHGPPLSARVIAVYLAGWPVSPRHDLPQLAMPACRDADQAGCVMGWITFANPADPREVNAMAAHYPLLDGASRGDAANDTHQDVPLCANPLTGGAGADAPAAANLGSLAIGDEKRRAALVRPSVGARCDPATGLLMIARPPHLNDAIMPGNNYSINDFPLFWCNLRGDVARREAAWMRTHRAA